ncbi:GGDEF domain-containing protein [Aliidiomarina sp. Khilg15.8]
MTPSDKPTPADQVNLVNDTTQLNELLWALQKHLEVDKLLSCYSHYIQAQLPLESLLFNHHERQLTVYGRPHYATGPLSKRSMYADNDYLGDLFYHFAGELTEAQQAWLEACEHMLQYPLRNAVAYYDLRSQAVRDHLTDLGNRVLLEEVLEQLLCVQERADIQHAVMLLDLDNFKTVNDEHGHQRGDAVLMEFAAILRQQLRNCDRLFRYGGDEFLIIVANPDEITLQRIFRRLQLAINDNNLLSSHQVSCSAGAVLVKPAHTMTSLLDEADTSLYQAKQSGRNQMIAPAFRPFSQLGHRQ